VRIIRHLLSEQIDIADMDDDDAIVVGWKSSCSIASGAAQLGQPETAPSHDRIRHLLGVVALVG
jgi:hypothetical protein